MPQPLPRLPGPSNPLTRKVTRRPAAGVVLVQSAHGQSSTRHLRDISVHGCNLIGEAEWLKTGMFLTVHLSSERSIQAIVRWVRGDACGIEFLRPISSDEADAMAERAHDY